MREPSAPQVPPLLLGAALVAGAALAGRLLSAGVGQLLGYATSPLSPVVPSIVFGMAVATLRAAAADAAMPATTFFSGPVLRLGIVLLGLNLSLATASEVALAALPVVVVCVATALVLVTAAGRLLGLERRLAALIAVGTGICGITAIAATAPLIRAREAEIGYAVACITLFGMTALLVHPLLAHVLFAGDPVAAGIFLGAAIHDTSQVAGAALAYAGAYDSPEALEAATVTKLMRNLFMAAVIPLAAFALRREAIAAGGAPSAARPPLVPAFVVLFVAACAVRSVAELTPGRPLGVFTASAWRAFLDLAATASEWALLLAMAALGLRVRFRAFAELGARPWLLALFAAVAVGAVAVGGLHWLRTA
ncbi:MAG: putative sulfate exporter family transporter [Steroidobacteraceae bacterium]|nr:putative sulfate exporter family transporter [Steroidobacteraceae bacterium]